MQNKSNKTEFEDTEQVSVGDIFYNFLPYWPFFIFLVLLSMAAAWIYLRYEVPIYQTTATLFIKDDKNNTPGQELLQSLDLFGSQKNVENEVAVLRSKTLMEEVAKNLHLYAPVTIEGRVLNQSAYIISPIVVEAEDPDSLDEVVKVPFKYNKVSHLLNIGNINYPLNQSVSTPFGMLKFIANKYYHSTQETKEEYQFYFSLSTVKKAADNVLGNLDIESSSKESTVIDLNLKGEIPKRSEDIINELLKVYNEAAILDKNEIAANTLKFVQERLKFVSSELDSVERQLQDFKSRNKITDISAQGQLFLQTVAANDQKISDTNMQLTVLDQVEKYVENKEGKGGIVPATLGMTDPVLTNLLQQLSDLELRYTQTKKIVPENNPAIIALVDAINKVKPAILENIQNQRKNLVAARNDLEAISDSYTSTLKAIPEKERELLSISRQQAIKNDIYTFLLQKREETALSYASAVADSRIIDRAQSSDIPVSPKKKIIYFGALLGALIAGFAIIYLKEILTRTVQSRGDIEKYTDIPFLGEINYDWSNSPIVVAEGKRSFIAEQFRQLRTSLGYMGIDETHKRILVTSSITQEGKSFIAINLGISLSLMDKKVVLLELDLRKPKLSEQFKVSRSSGLSNYLIGKMPAEDLIKSTGIKNLSLIPSGPIPPNPSELISNGKLIQLLTYLEKTFDYILLDTAPVNPVADPYILSPLANVTLYIIRHGYTPKMFIHKLEEKLKTNTLKNPAIVYNGVKGKGVNKYGYGYGYGYSYGYGYTEEGAKKNWWKNILKRKGD